MKGIEVFRIHLEDKRRTFYPGEALYGQLSLKIKEEIKIQELRLQCHGEAHVNWPESSGSYTRFHHNNEQYFHAAATITGKVPSLKTFNSNCLSLDRSKRMSAGDYGFSFKFIIPDKCLPPSFEGTHGYIRYWIQAVIDRGFGKRDVKTKAARFIIGNSVGIDEFGNISKSVQSERTKSVGCCPCSTKGSLSIRARTDKTGYEQGETVYLHVSISNKTRHHVTAVGVSLVQKTVYSDIEKQKKITENTVVSTVAGYVIRNSDVEFAAIPLAIPPRLNPTLMTCKCLSVCYCAKITVKLKRRLTKATVIELPIIIASAPQKQPCQEYSNVGPNVLNNGIKKLGLQKRGTMFYLLGTPSSRQQKPLIPNGRPYICFAAKHQPYKYPKHTGVYNEADLFFIVGSPIRYKKRVSLV